MPELIQDKKVFTLLEVTQSIQRTLTERYSTSFWIKAEMNKLNHYSHSGHCYPDLVEKRDGKVVAQLRSMLWKRDYLVINARFVAVLNEPIKDGINVLLCAKISFDPSHGLSLLILDIDPSFTLGELEREKQSTIEKLKAEGAFDKNKKLRLAQLPQRIAVISVETSKGYADYLKVIEQNPWGYKFLNVLFPSLLQGDKSIAALTRQLKRIKTVAHHFDAVAIIRGGGGDVGLSSFNNYKLARAVALFPIPVITGIGHSTNETVVEMVSYRNAITPTELADFLIQEFHNFSIPVKRAEEIIRDRATRMVRDEKLKFRALTKYFQSLTTNSLNQKHHALESINRSVAQHVKFSIKNERQSLGELLLALRKNAQHATQEKGVALTKLQTELKKQSLHYQREKSNALRRIETTVKILDPLNIVKRGFSITLHNGKAIRSLEDIPLGAVIQTVIADGELTSTISSTTKKSQS